MTKILFWKANGKGCALSRCGICLYRAAAQLDDPADNGKPQPVSLAFSGGIPLIKFIKYMLCRIFVHADACVTDYSFDTVRLRQLNDNRAALRCEFDCVGKKIEPYLHEQFIISIINYILEPDIQFQIFSAPVCFQ